MVIRKYYVIGTFYFLTGCQTVAQTQYNHMQEQALNTDQAGLACINEAKNSPAGLRLKETFILDENDPEAFKKMLIDRVATEQEKNDLIEMQGLLQPCRTLALEGYSKVHPALVNLLAKAYSENDQILVRVIQDEITVGEVNSISEKLRADRKKEWYDTYLSITQQYQYSHQQEMQNRQAAAAALQQWNYQQQILRQNQYLINSLT